jgi:hypothetical protein
MSPRNGDEVVEIGIILFRFNAVHHDEVEVVETYVHCCSFFNDIQYRLLHLKPT